MWHLLEVSLQQSQLPQDMTQGLHAATQDLLSLKQTTPTVAVTLPDLAQDAQCLLIKLTTEDDVEALLGTFERVATREG